MGSMTGVKCGILKITANAEIRCRSVRERCCQSRVYKAAPSAAQPKAAIATQIYVGLRARIRG
jgi:hypothetical protein